MRAAVYYGPGDVRVEELEAPRPGPGEVLLRLLACGICGSDLMDWYVAPRAPLVLGHEPVGEVAELGPDPPPEAPAPGTRVFVHHHVPCFVCERCRRGRHTLCPSFKGSGIRPGGLSELILVPRDNARFDLLPLPDHLPTETATLVEPLACCVRGQRWAGVGPATRLAVLGAGQVGLLHVQLALAQGCRQVVAADPLPERRKVAEALGAASAEPAAPALVEALGGRPDVVIACTGATSALELALEAVDDGGTVQLFAPAAPGQRLPLDPTDLFFREVTLQASYSAGPADTREALRLLASGTVTGEGIVTHRFPLEEAPRALAAARSGEAIKVVVEGPGAGTRRDAGGGPDPGATPRAAPRRPPR
ncbi:MAG TPA: alcohol dehydrogenase catalytic domain-containing protein [Actinomycetota bacterium]|nr:alcohol dehydrogenase catalytic domain-containing protein [Actinomycetota bacterium]